MIGVATFESITGNAAVPGQYLHIHPHLVMVELMFIMLRCSEFTFSASRNPNVTEKTFRKFGHSDTSFPSDFRPRRWDSIGCPNFCAVY